MGCTWLLLRLFELGVRSGLLEKEIGKETLNALKVREACDASCAKPPTELKFCAASAFGFG